MTAGQQIDYEALVQEAMRGVVRAVLQKVALSGLVGDHHFYIAFNTQAAGVIISRRLKEKYPSEMTIVLQHRFWDLEVNDERFEVKLTFDGIPERLVVPFRAVKVFYDPSVPYGLQFEASELMSDAGRRSAGIGNAPIGGNGEAAEAGARGAGEKRRDRTPKRPRPEARSEPVTDNVAKPQVGKTAPAPVSPVSVVAPVAAVKPASPEAKPASPDAKPATPDGKADEPTKADPGDAKVVDLSKFRKK